MLGLVLEGGGAKGAFHMGAVRALLEEGYSFDAVAGTSIGAINGAIIAQGDFEAGYKMWETMDNEILFDIEQTYGNKGLHNILDKQTLSYISSKIKGIIDNKGIDTSKIRNMLESIISEEKLRASEIDYGMVTVSLTDLKPLEIFKEDIPEGKLIDYIMASSNLPVFKSEPLDDKVYLDGGFYDNLPINLLAQKGYKEIIAIRTNAAGVTRKVEDKTVKVTYIEPSEQVGSILNFDNSLVKANMKLGYYDAMRVIKHLKGKKYYIKPVDDNVFFNNISQISEKSVYELGEILFVSKMEPKRMLFEKVIPTLAKILKLDNNATYQDIIICTLEYLAQAYELERFEMQDFYEFLVKLKENEIVYVNNKDSKLDFKRINLSSVLSGEMLLQKAGYEFLKNLTPDMFLK